MNYYGYNNYQQQPYMPQQPMPMQQMAQPQTSMLNGKVVDGIEVARASEVPIGGYGVFPKADLSEIYVKTWNNNGTTSVNVYKMAEAGLEAPEVGLPRVLERLNQLEVKIDSLITAPKKKEVKLNEY